MGMEARVTWVEDRRFVGHASSGHAVVLDGSAEKLGPSPMELLLIGMAGCTAYDVVSILEKKRQDVTGLEVRAQAERAESPPRVVGAWGLCPCRTGIVHHVEAAYVSRPFVGTRS